MTKRIRYVPQVVEEPVSEVIGPESAVVMEEVVTEVADKQDKIVDRVADKSDDMSDLFEPPHPDDADMKIDDLVDVNVERDVMGGKLDGLVEVDIERDVMGGKIDDLLSMSSRVKKKPRRLYRLPKVYPPTDTSVGGTS